MKQRLSFILILLIILSACSSDSFSRENPIHVISREDGSGTRSSFTSLSGIAAPDQHGKLYDNTTIEAAITNSTSVVMMSISEDPHAIGYLSLGSLNDTVKPLSVDKVPPTTDNIQSGAYPLARPFLIVVKGELTPLSKDFLAFILSEQGQTIVQKHGYIPNQTAEPYEAKALSGKIVVGGSSSVSPVMEKLKESYLSLYPDATVEIQQSDSTTGIASVLNGTYDIGMSSRALTESELRKGILSKTIATDGLVVIVNHSNPLENLELEAIRKIFSGEYTLWSSLEGTVS